MNLNNKEFENEGFFLASYAKVVQAENSAKAILESSIVIDGVSYPVNAQTQAALASVIFSGEDSKWTCYVGGVKTRILHTHEQLKAINLAGKHRYDEVKEWEENTINAIVVCETLTDLNLIETNYI